MSLGAALLAVMGGASWSPSSLAPIAWYDAQSITPQSDNSDLTTWPDISGNGYDLTQATAGNKPHYRTAGINGLPSVDFDGADDYLESAGTLTLPHPFTVAVVAILDTVGARRLFPAVTSPQIRSINASPSGTTLTAGGGLLNAPAVIPLGSPGVWMGVFDGVASVSRSNDQEASGDAGSTGMSAEVLRLGHNASTTWDGDIGEVLLFDFALDAGQRDALYDYFVERWGL